MTITSATEKPQQMATVGTKITLISKAQVRYEGSLFSVDPVDGTVGLARVRVYGTEKRKNAPKQVPPLDEVYAYILFRGTDIQDLTVNDSISRGDVNNNDNDSSAFLTDPAIIKTAIQPPHDPLLLHGSTQSGNILASNDNDSRSTGRHQYFHPDTLTAARTRHVSDSRDERLPPPRNSTSGNRRSGQFYRDYGDRQESRVYARERDRDRDDMSGRRRGPGFPYGWQPYDNRYDSVYKYPSGHYGGFDYVPQPPQRVVFLPRGTTRAPTHQRNDDPRGRRERPPDLNSYRMQQQNNRSGNRQGQSILRRPVVMYARQGGPNNGGIQGDSRMASYVDYRRPQRQRTSSGYYPRQGYGKPSGQRAKEYLHDYDFEKMNAELELEFKKEPENDSDHALGKSSMSPEAKLNGIANGEASPSICYDKQTSFFDRITRISDASKARVDRADERRINEETFGRQFRPTRRGRRGNSRPLQYY